MNSPEKINRAHSAIAQIRVAFNEVHDLAEKMELLDEDGFAKDESNYVCIAIENLASAIYLLNGFVEDETDKLNEQETEE